MIYCQIIWPTSEHWIHEVIVQRLGLRLQNQRERLHNSIYLGLFHALQFLSFLEIPHFGLREIVLVCTIYFRLQRHPFAANDIPQCIV